MKNKSCTLSYFESSNSKKVSLVDVMNTKSEYHCRHSVNINDFNKIKKYYAIESRVYNGIFDKNENKYMKGNFWFTNYMIFDFDYDEDHFPDISDYNKKLNDSLHKLYSILGNPKYIITNKNKYTEWQKKKYFTKNNIIKLPKKYGCQVVYELSESLQSQYIERVNLYRDLRMHITNLVDADPCFKGHMFKNFHNRDLFNVKENENNTDSKIDIYRLSKKLKIKDSLNKHNNDFMIDIIWNLKPFESLKDKNKLPKYLEKYSNELCSFYNQLNNWKFGNNKKIDYLNNSYFASSFNKTSSRNETLFNFLSYIPIENLKSISYNDIFNYNLFDKCDIKENIDEVEFDTTKESVLNYRINNNLTEGKYFNGISVYENKNIIDTRVFKIDQNIYDKNFFNDKNKDKFRDVLKSLFKEIEKPKTINIDWIFRNRKVYINCELYKIDLEICKDFKFINESSKLLSNLFLSIGPEYILSNIQNLINQNFIEFVKNDINSKFNNLYYTLGMIDILNIIKGAIYYTHFKYYHSIQIYRKNGYKNNLIDIKRNSNYIETVNKKNTINILSYFGVRSKNIKKNKEFQDSAYIKDFNIYYNRLKKSKDNLLKENGMAKPISFYQDYFKISTLAATIFTRKIKNYLKFKALKEKLLEIIKAKKNNNKNNINCYSNIFKINKILIDIKYFLNNNSYFDLLTQKYNNSIVYQNLVDS